MHAYSTDDEPFSRFHAGIAGGTQSAQSLSSKAVLVRKSLQGNASSENAIEVGAKAPRLAKIGWEIAQSK